MATPFWELVLIIGFWFMIAVILIAVVMELFAGLLTTVLGIAGAPGIAIDKIATDYLRSQIVRADVLEVRVDNAPNYQILLGNVDRIRVAGRGVFVLEFLRIDQVDLETDPISIDPSSLQSGKIVLRRPLQAAVRLVLRSEDINTALRSPDVQSSFKNLSIDISGTNKNPEILDLLNPEVTFLEGDRVRLAATLQAQPTPTKPNPKKLDVSLNAELKTIGGTKLQIVNPQIELSGTPIPNRIATAFTNGLNKVLDLRQLESKGITARVLKLELTAGKMQVIGFAKMDAIPNQ
ncbi:MULTISPECIES: DUF2993 domain-containing protein [Pseudanabaena]|uniref:DUF2993 domain-containing protein n=2 Tax=Pseudanabaena TaxID=1152 RepID=L8MTF1_9CYAN|nr:MULTISPECIES: DUF2993 domain-containing protein [Pseudanabaena]ELS31237.1 hypothetical protein Pse7429DRAFT_3663 [Pseudanabaena biceps PCC 7429]MDG3496504.1 DUF2993 domain-containing protein [Pseudanabaena catenata USMAC16]